MTLSKWFKDWFKGPDHSESREHTMVLESAEKLVQPVPTWLTQGTWVITPKGLGIVVDLSSYGEVGIMIVTRDTGENIAKHMFDFNVVRRAYIEELPTLRPRAPDEIFLNIGYQYGTQRT